MAYLMKNFSKDLLLIEGRSFLRAGQCPVPTRGTGQGGAVVIGGRVRTPAPTGYHTKDTAGRGRCPHRPVASADGRRAEVVAPHGGSASRTKKGRPGWGGPCRFSITQRGRQSACARSAPEPCWSSRSREVAVPATSGERKETTKDFFVLDLSEVELLSFPLGDRAKCLTVLGLFQ